MQQDTQLLIAHDRLTAEAARRQEFPTVLRGLDRQSVEEFRRRAAQELHGYELHVAELARQLQVLRGEHEELAANGHPDTAHGAVDVLTRATVQADQIIADAQTAAHDITGKATAQADQIIAGARQQAGGIVGRATQEAEREAARIRREAPAEAQRITVHYTALAAAVRAGLISDLDSLSAQLQQWSAQAQQGPGTPPAQAAGG